MIKRQKKTEKTVPSFLSLFHLEADKTSKGFRVRLSGIIGISDYSETNITVLSHSGRIRIFGERLFSTVFENNHIEIEGKISGVEFLYGKN